MLASVDIHCFTDDNNNNNNDNKPDMIKKPTSGHYLKAVCKADKTAEWFKEIQTKYIELRAVLKESTKVQTYIKSI